MNTTPTRKLTRFQHRAIAAALFLAGGSGLSARSCVPTASASFDWNNAANWNTAIPNAVDAIAIK